MPPDHVAPRPARKSFVRRLAHKVAGLSRKQVQALAQAPTAEHAAPSIMPDLATSGADLPSRSTSHYTYQRLDESRAEFRILWLYPSVCGDQLMGAFSIVSRYSGPREFSPPFEALSYTWGAPEMQDEIRCTDATYDLDDSDGSVECSFPLSMNHKLPITSNLRSALQALRLKDDWRPLWIDALCINQADLDEKTSQVRSMHMMYKHAQRTVIYLGDHDDQTEEGLRTCIELASMDPYKTDSSLHVDNLTLSQERPSDWPPLKASHATTRADWSSFCHILQKPWFFRTWVVQEVVLGVDPIVVIGQYSLPWETLQLALELVIFRGIKTTDSRHRFVANAQQFCEIRVRRKRVEEAIRLYGSDYQQHARVDNQQISLFPMLAKTRSLHVSDPRDKVFALVNIGAPVDRDLIDYRRNTREVYISVLHRTLAHSPDLAFLSYVDAAGNWQHGFPTWVTNWYHAYSSVNVLIDIGHTFANAGTGAELHVVFPDPSTFAAGPCPLIVRGISVEKVTGVAGIAQIEEKDRLQTQASMLKNVVDPYPTTRMGYLDLYSRVIDPNPTTDYALREERTEGFWATVSPDTSSATRYDNIKTQAHGTRNPPPTPSDLLNRLPPFFRSLESFYEIAERCSSRRFALTKHGFMGLVPQWTRPGDEILVLFGHTMPVVARPLSDGTYHFVGDAFVLGIMDGEALVDYPQSREKDFVFV